MAKIVGRKNNSSWNISKIQRRLSFLSSMEDVE